MLDRRTLLTALGAAPAALGFSGPCAADVGRSAISQRMSDLERATGGRLGVAALDLASGARFVHRADERFPMCSTFKASLVGLVLRRVDQGRERLDRIVPYGSGDLVNWSPVTKDHVGAGLPVSSLCEAAMTISDNTAANLLIDACGGPQAVTAFWRSLGDPVSRLDRREPKMSEARPGDLRDTTSPAAMLGTLRKLVLGNALSSASRTQLTEWLVANRTGDHRLRAGLPANWRIGDKTGSGGHGTTNDIAIAWPASRAPLLVTVYLNGAREDDDGRDVVLASVGRLLAGAGFGGAA